MFKSLRFRGHMVTMSKWRRQPDYPINRREYIEVIEKNTIKKVKHPSRVVNPFLH